MLPNAAMSPQASIGRTQKIDTSTTRTVTVPTAAFFTVSWVALGCGATGTGAGRGGT